MTSPTRAEAKRAVFRLQQIRERHDVVVAWAQHTYRAELVDPHRHIADSAWELQKWCRQFLAGERMQRHWAVNEVNRLCEASERRMRSDRLVVNLTLK